VAILAMVDRPRGDIAQSEFNYLFSVNVWRQPVQEAILTATATVNETHPDFRPAYDHRLDHVV